MPKFTKLKRNSIKNGKLGGRKKLCSEDKKQRDIDIAYAKYLARQELLNEEFECYKCHLVMPRRYEHFHRGIC